MIKKLFKAYRDQKGITGLETAIILIAFVVVAAVFAYTVLSAGLFSTQKSQEAVYSGLEETQSTMEVRGSVVAYKAASLSGVGKVEITLSSNGSSPIDLTPAYEYDSVDNEIDSTSLDNLMFITFSDQNVAISDCAWSVTFIGKDDADYLLEENEKAVVTVWFHDFQDNAWAAGANPPFLAANRVDTDHTFTLELKPSNGAVLNMTRTTPAVLDTVMDLH